MNKQILLNVSDEDITLFEELFSQSDIEIIYKSEQVGLSVIEADYTLFNEDDIQALKKCKAFIQEIVFLLDGVDEELSNFHREDLEIILKNAHQYKNIIAKIFNIIPIYCTTELFIEPVYINHQLIDEVVSIFKTHEKNLNVKIHISGELLPASTEKHRIRGSITRIIKLIYDYAQAKSNLNILVQQIEDFILVEFAIQNFTFDINMILDDSDSFQKYSELFITEGLVKTYGGEFWFERDTTQDSTLYFSLPIFIE